MSGLSPEAAARQAALVVHGLAGSDSAWLLQALPAAHRALLDPLLRELAALGIPRERPLLESAATLSHGGDSPAARLAKLEETEVRSLARMLQDEPPGVTACLLAAREWSWRDALLAQFDANSRDRIQALVASYRDAASLQTAVLGAIASALRDAAAVPIEPPAARRLWMAARSAWRRA